MSLLVLGALSLIVMMSDIRKRKISNITVVLIGVITVIITLVSDSKTIDQQLFQAAITIAVGFLLTMLNIFGAGDSKLLAAYSLGISPALYPGVLFVVCVLGALIAIVLWLSNRQQLRQRGVPYGLAIAPAGLAAVALSAIG
ncbi:prepilin peptidase [Ferrimonas sp. SCSIO 43195]|uniref:A24 family peptidase n=1 Tax=Ferrimonas sp. SCSIO 43195 TaxID=2822844 RepID=UPI00218A6C62|nr:prepilin peptidase [Ferrimonas sp. SCSIO 43195]